MVLLAMWNMFGKKFLRFIGGLSVGRVQQSHALNINRWEHRWPFQCGKDYYIFKKKYVRVLYMSFHSYRVVFCAPIPIWEWELPILDPVAWVIAFKLHGEGILGSQALSIALQGWALDDSFLYSPSRHVEHVWAKIPQFHRRLVSWAGATEPPAHNKSMRT